MGANPAALMRSTQLTLAEGAVLAWPSVKQPLFAAMLAALSAHTGLPTDVPFEQLSPRHRRIVMYGTGDEWITVKGEAGKGKAESKKAPSPQSPVPSFPVPIQRSLSRARRGFEGLAAVAGRS